MENVRVEFGNERMEKWRMSGYKVMNERMWKWRM